MSLFKKRLAYYRKIKQEKEDGKFHFIPFKPYFPKFSKYLHGIYPSSYVLLSAFSGMGKSKFARYAFCRLPLHFASKNKGVKVTVIINALEETKEEVIDHLINSSASNKGINTNWATLRGFSNDVVNDEQLDKLDEIDFSMYEENLHVIDESNTFGIYKYVRNYMNTIGTFYDFDDKPIEGEFKKNQSWARYEADDPNHFVILIIDHLSLISTNTGKTHYQTLKDFSANDIRRKMSLKMGLCCVVVQQHYATSGKKQFTSSGKPIIEALIPTPDHLGDMRNSHRAATVHIALFDPQIYGIDDMYGWQVPDKPVRTVHLLKNRYTGNAGIFVPMWFDGDKEKFKEIKINNNN